MPRRPSCLAPMLIWSFLPITLEHVVVIDRNYYLDWSFMIVYGVPDTTGRFWLQRASDANLKDISGVFREGRQMLFCHCLRSREANSFFCHFWPNWFCTVKATLFHSQHGLKKYDQSRYRVDGRGRVAFFLSVNSFVSLLGGRVWTVNVFKSLDIVWKKPRVKIIEIMQELNFGPTFWLCRS